MKGDAPVASRALAPRRLERSLLCERDLLHARALRLDGVHVGHNRLQVLARSVVVVVAATRVSLLLILLRAHHRHRAEQQQQQRGRAPMGHCVCGQLTVLHPIERATALDGEGKDRKRGSMRTHTASVCVDG